MSLSLAAKFGIAVGATAVMGACTAYASYEIVPTQNFGVRTKFGQMVSDEVKPGIYWRIPLFEKYTHFSNNTIILDAGDIGSDKNSQDRNTIKAKMRLHYRVMPKTGLMAVTLDTMANDNGKEKLKELMGQAVDSVVGQRPATDTNADKAGFLKAFADNLNWRLRQNNLPINIEAIEINTMTLDATMPTQMRMRPEPKDEKGWTIENMAGPAALPVMQGIGEPGGPTTVRPAAPTPATTVTASAAPAPSAAAPKP